jgi:hypothetical protein
LPAKTSFAAGAGLAAGAVLVTLLMVELGCRLARGPEALLHWTNWVQDERLQMARQNLGGRFVYEPTVGYVHTPGYTTGLLHYDKRGFRVMPPLPEGANDASLVLATGASFTLGDEVTDDESWPAQLQGLLRRRTVNAGVAAYALDQIVLRTEQLAAILKPALLVVGFTADNLRHAEMSRTWGVPKPYFELEGSSLVLRNVPVPLAPDPRSTLDVWQHALGWSVALDMLMTMKGWRYEWVIDHQRVLPRGAGEQLACPLMQRLAGLGIPTLVVAQYDFYVWVDAEFGADQHRKSQVVLSCAEQAGLAALDTYDAVEKAVHAGGRGSVYGPWHPNAAGYRLIAEQLAAELSRRGIYPPP